MCKNPNSNKQLINLSVHRSAFSFSVIALPPELSENRGKQSPVFLAIVPFIQEIASLLHSSQSNGLDKTLPELWCKAEALIVI